MSNNSIGSILKSKRSELGLSVSQVSDFLISNGIARAGVKTIYSWENNNSQPTPDALLLLCKLYNIEDVLLTFGYSKNSISPNNDNSPSEASLIKKYRRLNDSGKEYIDTQLDYALTQAKYMQDGGNDPAGCNVAG
ncbi:MAG: helix-turn-helix transcriptional regulator [Angelakisella sp.]|nr:helix-turn-helix transcriptional regulator [Angelakisella sp.]